MDLKRGDKTMSCKTREPVVANMPREDHESHLKARIMTTIIARGSTTKEPLLQGCDSSGLKAVTDHTMMWNEQDMVS